MLAYYQICLQMPTMQMAELRKLKTWLRGQNNNDTPTSQYQSSSPYNQRMLQDDDDQGGIASLNYGNHHYNNNNNNNSNNNNGNDGSNSTGNLSLDNRLTFKGFTRLHTLLIQMHRTDCIWKSLEMFGYNRRNLDLSDKHVPRLPNNKKLLWNYVNTLYFQIHSVFDPYLQSMLSSYHQNGGYLAQYLSPTSWGINMTSIKETIGLSSSNNGNISYNYNYGSSNSRSGNRGKNNAGSALFPSQTVTLSDDLGFDKYIAKHSIGNGNRNGSGDGTRGGTAGGSTKGATRGGGGSTSGGPTRKKLNYTKMKFKPRIQFEMHPQIASFLISVFVKFCSNNHQHPHQHEQGGGNNNNNGVKLHDFESCYVTQKCFDSILQQFNLDYLPFNEERLRLVRNSRINVGNSGNQRGNYNRRNGNKHSNGKDNRKDKEKNHEEIYLLLVEWISLWCYLINYDTSMAIPALVTMGFPFYNIFPANSYLRPTNWIDFCLPMVSTPTNKYQRLFRTLVVTLPLPKLPKRAMYNNNNNNNYNNCDYNSHRMRYLNETILIDSFIRAATYDFELSELLFYFLYDSNTVDQVRYEMEMKRKKQQSPQQQQQQGTKQSPNSRFQNNSNSYNYNCNYNNYENDILSAIAKRANRLRQRAAYNAANNGSNGNVIRETSLSPIIEANANAMLRHSSWSDNIRNINISLDNATKIEPKIDGNYDSNNGDEFKYSHSELDQSRSVTTSVNGTTNGNRNNNGRAAVSETANGKENDFDDLDGNDNYNYDELVDISTKFQSILIPKPRLKHHYMPHIRRMQIEQEIREEKLENSHCRNINDEINSNSKSRSKYLEFEKENQSLKKLNKSRDELRMKYIARDGHLNACLSDEMIDYLGSNRRPLIPLPNLRNRPNMGMDVYNVGFESLSMVEYKRLFDISHLLESKKKKKKTKKQTRGGKQRHRTKGGPSTAAFDTSSSEENTDQSECSSNVSDSSGNSNLSDGYDYDYDYESIFDLIKHLNQFDSVIMLFDEEMIENYLKYYFFNYKRNKMYSKKKKEIEMSIEHFYNICRDLKLPIISVQVRNPIKKQMQQQQEEQQRQKQKQAQQNGNPSNVGTNPKIPQNCPSIVDTMIAELKQEIKRKEREFGGPAAPPAKVGVAEQMEFEREAEAMSVGIPPSLTVDTKMDGGGDGLCEELDGRNMENKTGLESLETMQTQIIQEISPKLTKLGNGNGANRNRNGNRNRNVNTGNGKEASDFTFNSSLFVRNILDNYGLPCPLLWDMHTIVENSHSGLKNNNNNRRYGNNGIGNGQNENGSNNNNNNNIVGRNARQIEKTFLINLIKALHYRQSFLCKTKMEMRIETMKKYSKRACFGVLGLSAAYLSGKYTNLMSRAIPTFIATTTTNGTTTTSTTSSSASSITMNESVMNSAASPPTVGKHATRMTRTTTTTTSTSGRTATLGAKSSQVKTVEFRKKNDDISNSNSDNEANNSSRWTVGRSVMLASTITLGIYSAYLWSQYYSKSHNAKLKHRKQKRMQQLELQQKRIKIAHTTRIGTPPDIKTHDNNDEERTNDNKRKINNSNNENNENNTLGSLGLATNYRQYSQRLNATRGRDSTPQRRQERNSGDINMNNMNNMNSSPHKPHAMSFPSLDVN